MSAPASGRRAPATRAGTLPAGLTAAALIDLYERMVLLRRFESVAQVACRKGETPGFLHLYIGEEATAVGVCAHLRPTDWITSTHRGHGHALAKGMDPNILMAELFGKRDGCCGGRGGTMHLYDRSVGLFGTNGIVAAGIGHAVGAGISARVHGTDGVGVAFFQALTQVQEMTLTFVPKIIAGFLIILMTGSYSGSLLKVFTEQLYLRIATGFK